MGEGVAVALASFFPDVVMLGIPIVAAALCAAAAFADHAAHGRGLERGSGDVAGQLSKLLKGSAITEPESRNSLLTARGIALRAASGEHEGKTGDR